MNRHGLATWLFTLSLLAGMAQAGSAADGQATAAEPGAAPLVVFLVRHGEKVDSSADASLSPAGEQRAGHLALLLRDAGIEQVHSTDYIRTRDTAAPTATSLDLAVQIYQPDELAAFADRLRATGGRHLVVGHSNTTPALVALLRGEPGEAIAEGWEYDRLYMVSVRPGGPAETVLLRYGDRSSAD